MAERGGKSTRLARPLFRSLLRLIGRLEAQQKRLRYGPVVDLCLPPRRSVAGDPAHVERAAHRAIDAVGASLFGIDRFPPLRELLRASFRTARLPTEELEIWAPRPGVVSGLRGDGIPTRRSAASSNLMMDVSVGFRLLAAFGRRIGALEQ